MIYLLILLLTVASTADATPACWRVLPSQSRISFTIDQAGAPLQGTFRSADGVVCVDAGSDRHGRARVTVDTASVHTELPKLDDALRGADFFDVSRWPQAVFESRNVEDKGGGQYEATGQLQVRGVHHDLAVEFTLMPQADGSQANLHAMFTIKRLDYGVGQGQWADTQWVGNEVRVTISARLQRITSSTVKPGP